jgi:hypothetical protein
MLRSIGRLFAAGAVCVLVLGIAFLAFQLRGDTGRAATNGNANLGAQVSAQPTTGSPFQTPPAAVETPAPTVGIDTSPGITAVKPQAVAGPSGARITEADVTAYLQTHASTHTAPGAITSIPSVLFLTNQEAAKQFTWYDFHRAPNSPVCIAIVHGNFTADGPPGYPDRVGSTDYVIFDATTGNLLGDSLQVDGVAP